MERLVEQQRVLAKSLKSLNAMVEGYYRKKQDSSADELDLEAYQAAVIKNFEISFDLLWKYLKHFLFVHYGVDVASPKKVFKEVGLQKLLSQEEVDTFLAICDDRNLTAHTYDPDHAYEVAESILSYYFITKPTLYRILEAHK